MRHTDTTRIKRTGDPQDGQRVRIDDRENHANDAVAFDRTETRADEMQDTVESWLTELRELVDEARASEAFQEWLDVQSRFHEYSYRNTLLIQHQFPSATRVAGYRSWQEEFDRQVKEGEQAIWIWAPVIAKRCPECENSRSYHEQSDCEYDEVPPEAWSKGIVAFKPVPVFDVSQTDGEPLPDLETAAGGDGGELLEALLEGACDLGVEVQIVPDRAWSHGMATGVCQPPLSTTARPRIEVLDRSNDAAVAGTLIHEFAHVRLHMNVEDPDERSKREVEAEAVAYIVGRYFGLDTSNSAFYLATWQGEEERVLEERLERISRTAETLVETVKSKW